MKINRDNYEIYFIDYWDGTLDPALEKELMIFLENNYDLKEEFDNFENVSIVPDKKIKFAGKESLKKPVIASVQFINEQNYEEYFIANIEGDLRHEESLQLEKFILLNPVLEKEYQLFVNTKLIADKNIIYENKAGLKKTKVVKFNPKYIYYPVSVAASFIILLAIYILLNKEKPTAKKLYANRHIFQHARKTSLSGIEKNIQQSSDNIDFSNKNNTNNNVLIANGEKSQLQKMESGSSVELAINDIRPVIIEPRNIIPKSYDENATNTVADNTSNPSHSDGEFVSAKQFLFKKIRKNSSNKKQDNPNKLNLWDVADMGLSGFNKIAKSDLKLDRETSANGKTTNVNFVASNFEFSRTKKK
jgi:hypothetical protein